jgi:hypothetical protein
VVITSPPTHWPDKPVVGPLNSYLGTHGRAIRAVTETRNHLGGLALVCDVLPVEANIQVIHTYFNTAAKRIREDDTTETRVEVGSSKSFLRIPDFLYFGAKLTYDTKGKPVPVTPLQVKESSLLPSGRTPFTYTKGLCLAGLGTPASRTPVQCSSTFTILEVAITSEALRAIALC